MESYYEFRRLIGLISDVSLSHLHIDRFIGSDDLRWLIFIGHHDHRNPKTILSDPHTLTSKTLSRNSAFLKRFREQLQFETNGIAAKSFHLLHSIRHSLRYPHRYIVKTSMFVFLFDNFLKFFGMVPVTSLTNHFHLKVEKNYENSISDTSNLEPHFDVMNVGHKMSFLHNLENGSTSSTYNCT